MRLPGAHPRRSLRYLCETAKKDLSSFLCVGGNGGLSLRRRRTMLRLLRSGRRDLEMEDYQASPCAAVRQLVLKEMLGGTQQAS